MNRAITFGISNLTKSFFNSKRSFGFRNFWLLSVSAIIILFGLCVFQILNQSAVSYLIGSYGRKVANLSQENSELQILYSQNGSLKDIDKAAKHLDFEPIAKIHYIEVAEGAVAKQ